MKCSAAKKRSKNDLLNKLLERIEFRVAFICLLCLASKIEIICKKFHFSYIHLKRKKSIKFFSIIQYL